MMRVMRSMEEYTKEHSHAYLLMQPSVKFIDVPILHVSSLQNVSVLIARFYLFHTMLKLTHMR